MTVVQFSFFPSFALFFLYPIWELIGWNLWWIDILKNINQIFRRSTLSLLASSFFKISLIWLWVVRTHSVGACRFCSSAFAVFIGVPTFPRIRASVSWNGVVSTDPIRTANRTDAFTFGFDAVAARFESLFSFDSIIFCNCSIRLLLFLLIDLWVKPTLTSFHSSSLPIEKLFRTIAYTLGQYFSRRMRSSNSFFWA